MQQHHGRAIGRSVFGIADVQDARSNLLKIREGGRRSAAHSRFDHGRLLRMHGVRKAQRRSRDTECRCAEEATTPLIEFVAWLICHGYSIRSVCSIE